MLFVYDLARQRMRIEVGPGLEGIFPDAFVGYLMREQTAAFFASNNRVLGLKSTMDDGDQSSSARHRLAEPPQSARGRVHQEFGAAR